MKFFREEDPAELGTRNSERQMRYVLVVLSLLCLPWQTRWFWEGPFIASLPWEWGRLAFYISWLPMLATMILAQPWKRPKPFSKIFVIGFCLLFFASLFTQFPRATFQWWVEVTILTLFVLSLGRLQISRVAMLSWFVISLLPHAALGVWQEIRQFVFASSWLGTALQNPLVRGVSVVEAFGVRHLRAYGGFPHPNIFGAWLVVGLIASVWLALHASRRVVMSGWIVCASAFATVLVFTLSRGAWIATGLGLFVFVAGYIRQRPRGFSSQRLSLILVCLLASASLAIWHERTWIRVRVVSNERLEQRSIDERREGIWQGIALFRRHWLVGVGPRVTLSVLPSPPVLPHLVPLLILDEVGLIGAAGVILVLYGMRRHQRPSVVAMAILSIFMVFALSDHFLWSTWSGMSLLLMALPELSEA